MASAVVNRALMAQERHASREDEQVALFDKLVPAYLINSILMPIFVFSFPYGPTQAHRCHPPLPLPIPLSRPTQPH